MTDTATSTTARETHGFQAEVRQLLDLMIHSLYSNREIFLRELISNASDACDKLRFEALGNPALFENDAALAIRVDYDTDARTIAVSDNGIGMNRDEVIANLGTIAKSGTREFFAKLTGDQQKDTHLIGQFGVGFYSSFIVADRVTVRTRRAGDPPAAGVQWESDGGGAFDIAPLERAARGTEITLHLREGQEDLASGTKLRSIIRKYSDHIAQPIRMKKEEWKDGAQHKTEEDETVNQASALWARPKSEITDEQYREFYKHVGHDFDDPLAWVHARVDYRDTTGGHEPPGTGSNGARRFPPDDRRLPRPHRGDAGCHGGARLPTRAACDGRALSGTAVARSRAASLRAIGGR